jgi:hypothetical protein
MIAARMRQTRFRLRVEAASIDRRTSIVLLAAIVVVFAFAFAIGRATGDTAPAPNGEVSSEHPGASVQVRVPKSLSAVPPIATLISAKVGRHLPQGSTSVSASSLRTAVTAQSLSAGLTSPVLAHHPAVAPSVSQAPSRAGGVPNSGAISTPTRGPSRSGAGSGGGGSFDSSG